MANERSEFFVLGGAVETAFKTKNSPESFPAVASWNLRHSMTREALEDATARRHRGANKPVIGTKAGSTFGFDTYLCGLGTAAGDDTTASATTLGPFLEATFGAENLDTGDAFHSSPGTAAAPVVENSGRFSAAGNVVGFQVGSTVEWRSIREITTASQDIIAPHLALSTTPTAGEVVYGTASYKLADSISTTLQARILTERLDTRYECYGCAGSGFNLNRVAPTELFTISWDWLVGQWTDDPSTVNQDALPAVTLPTKSPWMDSDILIWPYTSGSTKAWDGGIFQRKLRSLSFSFTLDPQRQPDGGDVDGLAGYWYTGSNPLSLTFAMDIDDAWRDSYSAGDEFGLLFTTGRTPGSVAGLYVDRAFISAEPTVTDDGGQMTAEVTMLLHPEAANPGGAVIFQG